MAHYFLYPQKDTTIFSHRELRLRNSGKDEILEIEKSWQYHEANDTYIPAYARSLIKFDLLPISRSMSAGKMSGAKFYLTLNACEAKEIPLQYIISAFPTSQSWEMGVGRKYDDYTTQGVSWKYRDLASSTGHLWISGSSLSDESGGGTWYILSTISGSVGSTQSLPLDTSSYYTGPGMTSPWYESTQSFDYEAADVKMDVTNTVYAWLNNVIPNEGFILKHSAEEENNDQTDYGTLRFFGMDTNTIYSPHLDICWDDSTFITGSLQPLNVPQKVIILKNLQPTFKFGSIVRIDIFGRERYPVKTFSHQSDYLTAKYLPQTTQYSIKDAETEEVIIDFDDYTKVSCDSTGNYFILDTRMLPQERYYKIIVKIENGDLVEMYEDKNYFKISR